MNAQYVSINSNELIHDFGLVFTNIEYKVSTTYVFVDMLNSKKKKRKRNRKNITTMVSVKHNMYV